MTSQVAGLIEGRSNRTYTLKEEADPPNKTFEKKLKEYHFHFYPPEAINHNIIAVYI